MESVKVEFSPMYLEALKELRLAHDALVRSNFQAAYEHCLNAQTEMKLMSGAVKSWLPVNND